MKISENIKLLKEIYEKEGDIEVCLKTPYSHWQSPVELHPEHFKVEKFMFERIVKIVYL